MPRHNTTTSRSLLHDMMSSLLPLLLYLCGLIRGSGLGVTRQPPHAHFLKPHANQPKQTQNKTTLTFTSMTNDPMDLYSSVESAKTPRQGTTSHQSTHHSIRHRCYTDTCLATIIASQPPRPRLYYARHSFTHGLCWRAASRLTCTCPMCTTRNPTIVFHQPLRGEQARGKLEFSAVY